MNLLKRRNCSIQNVY